ncbi:hypothetical protein [Paludibacterium sp. B53371]|uniref:hypothetical protein n=1 Tax=Paludibacterium sp. B53371 TaxID=2806263 RepID=UPI001C058491|nr:hypothetical protein [Paludibacterium sp. B53371]
MMTPPSWIKPLVIAVLIGTSLYATEQFGYRRAADIYTAKLATSDANHSHAMQQVAEQRLAEQAAASDAYRRLNEQAQKVAWELLQARQQLEATQRQLKQRIPNAINSDGASFTGLGPDSLRLYRQLLGYPTGGETDLPATDARDADQAHQTTGTEEGLPPADLLEHAADYGEWCQKLDAQVSTYIQLHTTAVMEAKP